MKGEKRAVYAIASCRFGESKGVAGDVESEGAVCSRQKVLPGKYPWTD